MDGELAGMVNAYVCDLGHITWTRNEHDGTTPFLIKCPTCHEEAYSKFYRVEQDHEVSHVWYRPTTDELGEMKRDVVDHVRRGGLLLRPVSKQSSISKSHSCDMTKLQRVSALDVTIRDESGVTDFIGYKCQGCGMGWVNLQYLADGKRTFSWKSTKELLGNQ